MVENSCTIPLAEYNFRRYSTVVIFRFFKALIHLIIKFSTSVLYIPVPSSDSIERFFPTCKDMFSFQFFFVDFYSELIAIW